MFTIEVKIQTETGAEWRPIRPSHTPEPYTFMSRQVAQDTMEMCYRDHPGVARVTEIIPRTDKRA